MPTATETRFCDAVPRDSLTYDHLEIADAPSADESMFRWKSGYQGELIFERRGRREGGHYLFRRARNAYRTSWMRGRYWNYESEEQFERAHNGNYGLITGPGCEPVSLDELEAFRRECYAAAGTGYFCHIRARWVRCKPTTRKPSAHSLALMQRRADQDKAGRVDEAPALETMCFA